MSSSWVGQQHAVAAGRLTEPVDLFAQRQQLLTGFLEGVHQLGVARRQRVDARLELVHVARTSEAAVGPYRPARVARAARRLRGAVLPVRQRHRWTWALTHSCCAPPRTESWCSNNFNATGDSVFVCGVGIRHTSNTVSLVTRVGPIERTAVILKTLVTGVAAAAVVAAAAGGVTSIASSTARARHRPRRPSSPWCGTSRCRRHPRPNCRHRCCRPSTASRSGGSFSGAKGSYIEGGLGRIEGIAADREYSKAAAKGYFPLSFVVADVDSERSARHRERHRHGEHRRHQDRARDLRRGPQPDRLADLEAVRPGAAVVGGLTLRLIQTGARTRAAVLSAVTLVAALGLAGCADARPAAGAAEPDERPSTGASRLRCPRSRRCPRPTQLTDVLYRLADTSIPAEQKVGSGAVRHRRRRAGADELRRGACRPADSPR